MPTNSGSQHQRAPALAPILSRDAHILIVDDDAQIRQLAAKLIREHGHRVSLARDGREMWQALETATIDLVILDVMLPGGNGLDLCRELRARTALPIIMVTALGSDTDRIVGLEIGADDYLAKPFNPRELIARINAVLRRAQASAGTTSERGRDRLGFDGWTLDTRRRELTNPRGAIVDLSTGEYDLLLTLLEAPQRVLTREQLLDGAKNRIATGNDRAIDIQVSRLRKKLDASEDGQAMIKTIRGTGYMLVPAVTRS
ncbi:MAG TPA: response regulator transcription factor [Hyphomicrobiaceae bacterium]|nr:response regulator transcription factor [Hyphomicrobiaceae bacterium]